ncbi:uncharacterized protein LOC134268913 [Saccostrea cucullata]|uniref:uncharacterized protein LOC134268913 n=1 Tax=Saccostrea cuccullata TaxID=36930 RepID=UPI002ED520D0
MSSIAAIYCPASINTVVNVRRCPRTSFEWKNASIYKNCTSEIRSCVRQTDFVYHCVINTYLNATVEVCASSTNILGNTCAEFNMEGARIQGHVDTVCTSCPFRYPSTDAYKFQSCYNLIKRVQLPTTAEKILSTLPSLQNTTLPSLQNTTLPSLQNTTFTMSPV